MAISAYRRGQKHSAKQPKQHLTRLPKPETPHAAHTPCFANGRL